MSDSITPFNRSMDRDDLFHPEARPTVQAIHQLIRDMYAKGVYMTSWYGTLEKPNTGVGMDNRGPNYEPLPDAVDDERIPWFLYWEIEAMVRAFKGKLGPGVRVLDAGGTSSLFSFFLASLGCEVHSIDINPSLIKNSNLVAKKMGWNLHAYSMDVSRMEFKEGFFDHCFSICVFEHLDFYLKQRAFVEFHRTMKPGGWVGITFDYNNPAPYVFDCMAFDDRYRNQLDSPERVKQVFTANGLFEFAGNQEFIDNGKRYLSPPREAKVKNPRDYSFGALVLRRKDFW